MNRLSNYVFRIVAGGWMLFWLWSSAYYTIKSISGPYACDPSPPSASFPLVILLIFGITMILGAAAQWEATRNQ